MDVRSYLKFLRKRWLTLVSVTLLGLLGGAVVTLTVTPVYESSTQLFVSTPRAGTSADLAQGNQFVQDRVQSYSNIATGNRVLEPVITQLGLKETPAQLAQRVSVQAPFNTVLISITVTDTSPRRAAAIANAVGSSLIGVVTELEQGSGSVGQSPVSLQTVETAQVPVTPISPKLRTDLLLGLLVGFAVAVGIAVLREALDVAVRTDTDLQQAGLTTLATMPFDAEAARRPIVMVDAPKSIGAESFRHLRTGVQFLFAAGDSRSLLVTSASQGDGKTTTAMNLAVALASAGSRVALVDADLRRPMVAAYLGLDPDEPGLTSVLVGQALLSDVLRTSEMDSHLDLLPAGLMPPNPSELLGSDAMVRVLRELEATHDVVIVDSAPLLPVTDSVLLAGATGGTLLVVASGRTKRPQLNRAVAAVRAVDARVVGAVLTMADRAPSAYSAYGYTPADDAPTQPSGRAPRLVEP